MNEPKFCAHRIERRNVASKRAECQSWSALSVTGRRHAHPIRQSLPMLFPVVTVTSKCDIRRGVAVSSVCVW
jgi:hypothetical protein